MSLRPVPPSDDQPHVASDALGWSESYSFHVVEPADRLALLTRIGVRPNEGIMDVGLDLYVSDGGLLSARHVRATDSNTADLDVEGVKYEQVEPLSEWKLSYDGPAHSLRSSRDAASHDAWHKSRLERLSLDLTFRAEAPPAALESAPDRFGQVGRLTGEIWVSGDEYKLDVAGIRERSWGDAGTTIPQLRRRFWVRFDDGAGLVVDRRVDDGVETNSGWLFQDGELRAITDVQLKTETEPGTYWQKRLDLTVVDEAGTEHRLEGDVVQLAPLPTVRGTVQAVVVSSIAWLKWGERSGIGVVEYLHQLENGQPVLDGD